MTRIPHDGSMHESNEDAVREAVADVPLDPWMLAEAREAVHELDADVVVPRAMMWSRIQRERRRSGTPATVPRATTAMAPRPGHQWARWARRTAAVAAVLVGGIAIGRYVAPTQAVPVGRSSDTGVTRPGPGPDALAGLSSSTDPARVAMQEHLARTVALLTSVRDDDPAMGTDAEMTQVARALLHTTRLLLDEPQLRDDRTRRLLQDLELVLVQVIQARRSAPETQRAPKETLQDTNLLTRVRALVTASSGADDVITGGD